MATMSVPAPLSRAPHRRPFALVVLAVLMFVKAGLIVAAVVLTWGDDTLVSGTLRIPGVPVEVRETPAAAVSLLVIAGILVLSALGLLRYRRAGWLLAMVSTGVFIAIDIVGFVNGAANHLWMALNIVTVFYLNQRDVREGVGVGGGALNDEGEVA